MKALLIVMPTNNDGNQLTKEKLRSYGGKFKKMSDEQALQYIESIEQLCVIICKEYLNNNNDE